MEKSSTKIISSNTIFPLPKESDTTGEKVRKKSGDLDDTKNTLVTTTDTVVKERNTDTDEKEGKSGKNVVEEAITPHISAKKKIDTVNRTDKSQASNKKKETTESNKADPVKSLQKSRYTQRTDTENKVYK